MPTIPFLHSWYLLLPFRMNIMLGNKQSLVFSVESLTQDKTNLESKQITDLREANAIKIGCK